MYKAVNYKQQKGQALLVVVLVMVVALTATLSVVSRSVVNLKTSSQQTDSQKALAAAEAAVEQAIKNGVAPTPPSLGGATYTTLDYKLVTTSAGYLLVNGGLNKVQKDEGAYIWLHYPPKNGTWGGAITIYWGDNSGDANNAALEIALISGSTPGTSTITTFAVDPSDTRADSNNFTKLTTAQKQSKPIQDKVFQYNYTISGITNGRIIKVIPIYNSTDMGVMAVNANPAVSIPSQGEVISVNATVGTVQRKVTVFQGYPQLPAVLFPYSIFSP